MNYITCLVIVVVDVSFRCLLCQCLVVAGAMFYLLRCSAIFRKIVEPDMLVFVSVQVVNLHTTVVFVVLQIM